MDKAIYLIVSLSLLSSSFADEPKKEASPAPSPAPVTQQIIYQLSAFDKVSISVYGEPDLETEQLITDTGEVFLPLLGAVKIGGMTVSDASKTIEKAFREERYLRKPVVTISIEDFAPKVVTVLGEVENPGSVTVPPGRNGLPIQIAIAEAGGFTGSARTTAVTVTRADAANLTAEDESGSLEINVDKLLDVQASSEAKASFFVFPDDVVFVPRRVF